MPTETLKLYELSDAHRQLMNDITEAGGELTPEQEQILDALETSITGKVEAICRMRQENLAAQSVVHLEVLRLRAMSDRLGNAADRLKQYLMVCLERAGRDQVQTPLFAVRIQKSPPGVKCSLTPDQIPAEFRRVIPEQIEFDGRAALKAYQAGEALPAGVEIKQGRHIVIK